MIENTPNPNVAVPKETAPMAADTKADSTDRQNRSLVKDLPPGDMKPANAK
ncbi:hypothetical protein [Burkholderia sp. S171]|uniref:hypothetical protein n=1 Tax=Burkholderia sp. S171 TaxID=1641860 RepID=UPI00131B8D8D|nr:hypothetical protein [Burkholderia sp. S171]